MSDKFIKAYCSRSGRFYGLRIEPVDGQMRCTDFYNISADDARMLASTIDVPDLQSASNLRPCAQCGGRRVAGCSCPSGADRCEDADRYRFQCLYCKELHICTTDEGSELTDNSRVGETIRLAQGQEVVISPAGAGALEHILVGVGWDVARLGAHSMDVDSSVLMRNTGRLDELIFFGNLEHESGCVRHMGDNLVGGAGKGLDNGDSENIHVHLRKVPGDCKELWFVLNIYRASEKHQTLKDVRNMYIRLTDARSGRKLVEYRLEQGFEDKTGVVIGKAYRSGGNWMFRAVGKGVKVDSVLRFGPHCTD